MVQVDFCNPANNETPLASLSFTILKATSGLKLGDSLIERRLRDDLIALAALVRVMTTFFEVVSADIAAYIHD